MKKRLLLICFLLALSLLSFSCFNKPQKVNAEAKSRYNLCVFLRFNDEEEHINDIEKDGQTRREIIDNTYNAEGYSLRDYYKCVSSDKINLKTIYLFPESTGFASFYLDGKRESYAKFSSTNPNGYTNEATAQALFKQDWSSKIQNAINKGVLPCSINSREETIPYEDLDSDGDSLIDCITLVFSPQEQTNFSSTRQEPLYPCMDTNSSITINTSSKKITSSTYNQWVPSFKSLIKTDDSSSYFLPFATATHEMCHTFGYKDLYDYYQKIFPVGNMSLMSDLIAPVPQYITSYEREINGWINKENIQTIASSGTYTLTPVMDENQTGIVTYKIPVINCKNKWVYLEYRNFSNKSINRYDVKNKNLYYSNGNAVEYTSGKSGVLVYLVDKDAKYPTNSHGNAKFLGLEVLGGDTTNRKRTDAPRATGDVLDVACYDSNGNIFNPKLKITIGAISETSAEFTINYDDLDNLQQITKEDINNDAVYDKLVSLGDAPLYNSSFDELEYLDLSNLDIEDTSFLNLFSFKNLKYLILFGNKISDVSSIKTFNSNHLNTIIILDNNLINLNELDDATIGIEKIFYGLQDTQSNKKELQYFINSSFNVGDYQVCYQFENESLKSLTNGKKDVFTLKDNVKATIKSYYFFTDKINKSFEYEIVYTPSVVSDPISLSLNGNENIYIELGSSFVDPGVETNYPSNLTTTITKYGDVVDNFSTVGTYLVTYKVTNGNETSSVTRNVFVQDTISPSISLIGGDNLSFYEGEYVEYGINYSDNSVNETLALTESSNILTIEYYLNEKKVNSLDNPGEYVVKYTAKDSSSNKSILNRNVKIIKKVVPIELELKGDSNITLELGDTYEEFGVETNYPNAVTIAITKDNTEVDSINGVGTYLVTYTVINYDDTESVTRTVVVRDTTSPTVSLIGNESIAIVENSYTEAGVNASDLSSFKTTIEYYLDKVLVDQITKPGLYKVKYIVTDDYNNETIVYRTVKVYEDIILSLNGDSSISLEFGDTYIEQGVSTNYSDNLITSITKNGVEVTEIKDIGDYIITYSTSSDIDSKYITRKISVIDTIAPTVTLIGEESISIYEGEYEELGVNVSDLTPITINIEYYLNDNLVSKIDVEGNYTVKYIVSDSSNNQTIVSRYVKVNKLIPISLVLNGNDTINVEYGDTFVDPSVTTNYKDNLIITIYYKDNIVDSIHDLGTYTITYKTSNDRDSKSVSRTVIVKDTTAPTVTLIGDDSIYIYENEYQEIGVNYHDNSNNVTLKIEYYLNDELVEQIDTIGSYIVKYIVSDDSNNVSFITRNVKVSKYITPIELTLNGDENIELELGDEFLDEGVTTNYQDTLSIVITRDSKVVTKIDEVGTYIITYKVTSENDSKSVTRTLVVKDTTPPIVTIIGDEEYVGLQYKELGITYTDGDSNCTISSKIYTEDNQVITSINDPGTYHIEYTIKDSNGNVTVVSRKVTIYKAKNQIDELDSSFDIKKEYYTVDNIKLDEEPTEGEFIIKYTVTDKYGNSEFFAQNQTIVVEEEPTNNIQKNLPIIIAFSSIILGSLIIGIIVFIYEKKHPVGFKD